MRRPIYPADPQVETAEMREYERYLEWESEHPKCTCCGETFEVDQLKDGECAECIAYDVAEAMGRAA